MRLPGRKFPSVLCRSATPIQTGLECRLSMTGSRKKNPFWVWVGWLALLLFLAALAIYALCEMYGA